MWIVSNQIQMHTNSKMQMRVSKSSTYCITASNAHPVGNVRSKLALSLLIIYQYDTIIIPNIQEEYYRYPLKY